MNKKNTKHVQLRPEKVENLKISKFEGRRNERHQILLCEWEQTCQGRAL